MGLDLGMSAGAYIQQHGIHAVSGAVRRWVDHPASVRKCGEPIGSMLPMVQDGPRTRLLGLVQCRNRFVDPYCSGWFRVALAASTARVLKARMAQGEQAAMVVLTVHHQAGDSLAAVLGWVNQSWSFLTRMRGWRNAGFDWIRFLDVVVGGPNGPHPHLNIMIVGDSSIAMLEQWLVHDKRWVQAVCKYLPSARVRENAAALARFGCRVVPVADDADDDDPGGLCSADNLSRYASRAVEQSAFEAVDHKYKQPGSGHSLMEYACAAHMGDAVAGRMLRESASDLCGRRSWTCSAGWRKVAADLPLLEDDAADADALVRGGCIFAFLPAVSYQAHRSEVCRLLDRDASEADWRALDQRLDLGINWLDTPIEVDAWLSMVASDAAKMRGPLTRRHELGRNDPRITLGPSLVKA